VLRRAVRKLAAKLPDVKGRDFLIRAGMKVEERFIGNAYIYCEKEKEQISAKACGRKKAYEEMVNVMYKISGGASEGECYEEYGIRCNLSEYRKFGMMLSQNLRKGTRGLTELLEREAEDAFEQRKNLAKKAGEEAGTKLMIPLFLMLIIVFAIVIVPAFFSIRI
jgi:tight adherence protein C